MITSSDAQLTHTVLCWAEEALQQAISARNQIQSDDLCSKSPGDYVTSCDVSIEENLCKHIREAFPDHDIIAEEGQGFATHTSPYSWYLDPIDGTTNFIRLASEYAISIALYREEQPLLGVVWSKERRYAADNQGYLLLPEVTVLQKALGLQDAVLHCGAKTLLLLDRLGGEPLQLLGACGSYRYHGCSSLELASVAIGGCDIYLSSSLKSWDYAAARLIIEASGAHFMSLQHNDMVLAWRDHALLQQALAFFPSGLRCEILHRIEVEEHA